MTEPLLSVRNLQVAFHQGGKTSLAVKGVSFDIIPAKSSHWSARVRVWQIGHGQLDPEAAPLPCCQPSIRRSAVQGQGYVDGK